MTIKEEIVEQLDTMNEAQLAALKEYLGRPERKRLENEFRLLDELAAPMSDEDHAVFEEAAKRRALFADRKLELKPDDR